MLDDRSFGKLLAYLRRVPALEEPISHGSDDTSWWVKFSLDLDHELAWHVVQEFGHVLNYLSLQERLPTVLKPVSPPPYMNGGPSEFLSWVIEWKERRQARVNANRCQGLRESPDCSSACRTPRLFQPGFAIRPQAV